MFGRSLRIVWIPRAGLLDCLLALGLFLHNARDDITRYPTDTMIMLLF